MIFDLAAQIRDAMNGLSAKTTDHSVVASTTPNTTSPPLSSQKSEKLRRNIVVDKTYRGDYTTISEAIEVATPGDIILVRPGLYNEGIVIDKPLEIVGEGDRIEIVVQASGNNNVILFNTTIGRVANLTLRHIGGDGEGFGVEIAQGKLTLEDCDISSQSRSCVIINDGADPRLRCNKIHDSKRYGVAVSKNGQGILEENDVFGNIASGVRIESGGFPILRRNRINKNGWVAIWIERGGGAVIEDNDLRDNSKGPYDISLFSLLMVKRARNLE